MIDAAALKSEILSDPLKLGYAAFLPLKDAKPLLALINGVPPSAAADLVLERVSASDIVNAIDLVELSSFSADQKQMVTWIVSAGGLALDNFKQAAALFPAGSQSSVEFLKLLTRQPTRAEQLFGRDSVVTLFDIAKALQP